MLAPKTRAAIRIGAVLYIVLGLVLFAAPEWSASVFPWSVTPLVAMTIGGWTLGNGIAAWFASAVPYRCEIQWDGSIPGDADPSDDYGEFTYPKL